MDFDTRRVTINRTLNEEGEVREGKGKTKGALRTITLPRRAIGVPREHRKAHIKETWKRGHEWNEEDFLFATIYGDIPHRSTVTHTWKTTLKKAGVEHNRLYQTRHTHATKLLANNVHPKLASLRALHGEDHSGRVLQGDA